MEGQPPGPPSGGPPDDDNGPRLLPRASVLSRLRLSAAHRRREFDRATVGWLVAGAAALMLLIVVPLLWPRTSEWSERLSTLLALLFLLHAIGLWLRMGRRAMPVAAVVVVVLYAATAWTSLLDIKDFFVLAVLVGFLIHVLAGFNLLFVLEEVVYDMHRLLHLRSGLWTVVPSLVVGALLLALPAAEVLWGLRAPTLAVLTPVAAGMLAIGWGAIIVLRRGAYSLMREIHLLVAGGLAGGALADAVALLEGTRNLVPSVVAYLGILGTWIYISVTTLQRSQYFLRGRDVLPWVALLLSSSHAVVAHVHSQYALGGGAALGDIVDLRVAYLVLGIWIGLGFFVLRGLWRVFGFLRDARRFGARTRLVAGRLARVTEELLQADQRMGYVTFRLLRTVEQVLPGEHIQPERPEYPPLDRSEGGPVPLRRPRRTRRRDGPRMR